MADHFTIQTRREAHEAGRKKYYTGKPCKHGHDAQRWVTNGICCVCCRDAVRKYNRSMNGADVDVTVRVHRDDAGAIRDLAAMLTATRDAMNTAAFDADKARAAVFPALANAPADYQPAAPTLRGKP
jgi:hypothetical protein